MYYKLLDLETSHEDWVTLNTAEVPSTLIVDACADPHEQITWVNRVPVEGDGDDCPELLGGFMPAWGMVWIPNMLDRKVRAALDAAGFEIMEIETHAISDVFGIDGAGYSFFGQHWIPLRALLASSRVMQLAADGMLDREDVAKFAACLKQWEKDAECEGESLRSRAPHAFQILEEARGL